MSEETPSVYITISTKPLVVGETCVCLSGSVIGSPTAKHPLEMLAERLIQAWIESPESKNLG